MIFSDLRDAKMRLPVFFPVDQPHRRARRTLARPDQQIQRNGRPPCDARDARYLLGWRDRIARCDA